MVEPAPMHCSFLTSVAAVPQAAWNALAGNQPFVRHEFLTALEESGSVGEGTGWLPETLIVEQNATLIAAVPLYRKDHSYGEYVFDWTWARAYAQAGLPYYPKLVAAVPFTPVTGSRLLHASPHQTRVIATAVTHALKEHANATGASSVHWLFTNTDDTETFATQGLHRRTGIQFHWRNEGWENFEAFLRALSAPKRKSIRRERRQVAEAGITFTVSEGRAITENDWDLFYRLYLATIEKYGAIAYLRRSFFSLIGNSIADIILILAHQSQQTVAGALFFRDKTTLYGRYWGTLTPITGLHFETCYYQALDYCLGHGLDRFEAGAQGEHKLSRGFLPNPTYSLHWLSHPPFNRAVEDFLVRENQGLAYYMNELNDHSPFHGQA